MIEQEADLHTHGIKIETLKWTTTRNYRAIGGRDGDLFEGEGMNRNYHQASESNQHRHSCWLAAILHRLAHPLVLMGRINSYPSPRPINFHLTQRDWLKNTVTASKSGYDRHSNHARNHDAKEIRTLRGASVWILIRTT